MTTGTLVSCSTDSRMDLCLEATKIVADVVSSDSPEGHLPDRHLSEDGDGRTAQLLLLCAWRTVKDASLLIGEVCSKGFWLPEQTLSRMAEHFVQQLSDITHRGAFEQAYVGFCQVTYIYSHIYILHVFATQFL